MKKSNAKVESFPIKVYLSTLVYLFETIYHVYLDLYVILSKHTSLRVLFIKKKRKRRKTIEMKLK